MKKFGYILVVVACMVSSFAVANAQEETSNATTVNYNQDARQARINELKNAYKISLSETEKLTVMARCKTAQKNLIQISKNLAGVTTERRVVYQSNIDNLKTLQSRLAASDIDSSSLDLLTVTYQQKLKAYEAATENYTLTIEDATTLDCEQDPESFRAALEGVRAARKKVVLTTSEIREITKSSLKTTTDTLTKRVQSTRTQE